MKEYKIVTQKIGLLKNNDAEFEIELNALAQRGWRVVSVVCMELQSLKAVLERDEA